LREGIAAKRGMRPGGPTGTAEMKRGAGSMSRHHLCCLACVACFCVALPRSVASSRRHRALRAGAFFAADFVAGAFLATALVAAVLRAVAAVVLRAVVFLAVDFAGAAFAVVFRAVVAFAVVALAVVALAVVARVVRAAVVFAAVLRAADGALPLATMSLKPAPARNAGIAVFFTFTASPVRGLRAMRAARTRFSKTPNPVMETLSPLVTAAWTSASTASSAAEAVFFSPRRTASASISSALFTSSLPYQNDDHLWPFWRTLCPLHKGFKHPSAFLPVVSQREQRPSWGRDQRTAGRKLARLRPLTPI